jgi:hypothetical protein
MVLKDINKTFCNQYEIQGPVNLELGCSIIIEAWYWILQIKLQKLHVKTSSLYAKTITAVYLSAHLMLSMYTIDGQINVSTLEYQMIF